MPTRTSRSLPRKLPKCRRNPSGERQCRRQRALSGVNWYTPATARATAVLQTASRDGAVLMPVPMLIGASLPSARDIPNATRPNAAQASRYPPTSAATWPAAVPPRRDRTTVRYIEATGATDGSIIAAIMTSHSSRNSPNTSHGPAIDPGIPGLCRISSTQATAAMTSSPAHRAGLLRTPGELAEVAIFAGVVEGQAVIGVVVPARDAAGDGKVAAHRVEYVDDLHDRRRIRRAQPFDLELHDARHLDPLAVAVEAEADRDELHPELLAHQPRQHLRRAAPGAGQHRPERFALLFVSALIQVDRYPPATLAHNRGRVHHEHRVEAVQADAVAVPLTDVHGERHVAALVVRRTLQRGRNARAEDVAIAVLHVLAPQLPGHGRTPLWASLLGNDCNSGRASPGRGVPEHRRGNVITWAEHGATLAPRRPDQVTPD